MADYTHRWTGNHPQQFSVGDKRVMLEPGGFLKLSKADLEHEDNAPVVNGGLLMDVAEKKGAN